MREPGGKEQRLSGTPPPTGLCSLHHSRFLGLFAMKLLVVTLASLSIFTGVPAFVLRDESSSKFDQLAQELRGHKRKVVEAVLQKAYTVGRSDIGDALSSWSSARINMIEQMVKALGDALPPEVKNVSNQASSAYRGLERKVLNDLRAIKNKAAPEREAFYQALESDLNPILEKLDPYTEPLRQTLIKACVEMDQKLNELLKWQLEQLQPHAKEIRIWLQEVKDSLEPIAGQVQKYLVQEVEKAYAVLQSSATRILEVFEKHREGFDQWVRAPLFPEDH